MRLQAQVMSELTAACLWESTNALQQLRMLLGSDETNCLRTLQQPSKGNMVRICWSSTVIQTDMIHI